MNRFGLLLTFVCVVAWTGSSAWGQLPPPPKESSNLQGQPRLIVDARSVDLGTVMEGDEIMVTWKLENRGDVPLEIRDTKASCGCTVVSVEEADRKIAPGGTFALKAMFNSEGRPGPQVKSVQLVTNDPIEPEVMLEFRAEVQQLFSINPAGYYRLGNVRRGELAPKNVELMLGANHKDLQIRKMTLQGDSALELKVEPFTDRSGNGQRIHFTVMEDAPLGNLVDTLTLEVTVDGIERTRALTIRGQVVGDLTWSHKLIDMTRQTVMQGQKLPAVTVRSTGKLPFKVLGASAIGPLKVTIEEESATVKGSEYRVIPSIADDAPAGPFGGTLLVRTNSVDQPLVEIPVFGAVTPAIRVEPGVVLLVQDGTRFGEDRRVRMTAFPTSNMNITEMTCSLEGVTVEIDPNQNMPQPHIGLLRVKLGKKYPKGTHEGTITIKTSVEGAETMTIPLVIDVP